MIGFRIGALAAGILTFATHAQTYPARPVTFVVPNAPGSSTDTQMRLIAAELTKRLGQPILINNKAGANTQIAAEFVAKAEPDGYTLFITTNTSHSANVSLYKNLRYDPVKDFTPITRIGSSVFVMLVNPAVDARSLPEFIALARKQPGKLSYAYAVSTGQLASELVRRRAGLEMVAVAYNSSPRAMGDLIGGQFEMYIADTASARPVIASGKARAIAVTSAEESPLVAGVPPIAATLPGVAVVSWGGLFGPAKLPAAVTSRIFAEVQAIMSEPAMRARFADLGNTVQLSRSPEEFGEFVRDQIGVWAALVKEAGLAPQ